MTPAVDYKKALEPCPFCGSDARVKKGRGCGRVACSKSPCHFYTASIPPEKWNTRALQPCAEVMTEDALLDTVWAAWQADANTRFHSIEGKDVVRFVIRSLEKSGHLKVKA